MKYKLVCSDLDDTLIGKDAKFGKGLKEAVKRYVEQGGKFCIVTGRMTSGALPVCRELGLKGEVITYQGAVVTDIETEKTVFSQTISTQDAVEVGRYCESRGYYYQTYIGDGFYAERPNKFTSIYARLSCAHFEKTPGKLSDYLWENKVCPPKLLMMAEPERVPEILEEMRGKFGDKFLINTSKPYIIEIIPQGISKGKAVERLAKSYGIKREEVICIGDSENDLTMIEYAGLGVVVGTGSEIAKRAADVIAPGMDDDPITWVLERFCIEQ